MVSVGTRTCGGGCAAPAPPAPDRSALPAREADEAVDPRRLQQDDDAVVWAVTVLPPVEGRRAKPSELRGEDVVVEASPLPPPADDEDEDERRNGLLTERRARCSVWLAEETAAARPPEEGAYARLRSEERRVGKEDGRGEGARRGSVSA